MERNYLKFLLLIMIFSSLLFLNSCGELRASYQVFTGNYAYSRGDYQNANIHYVRAAELSDQEDIITYNLGTVYQALGEVQAAQEQWMDVEPGDNNVLAFRFLYNRGIFYYQTGNYQAAYEGFRDALTYNPGSLDAKINLEYSLRKLNVQEQPSVSPASLGARTEGSPEEIQRILDYIRRTESQRPPLKAPQGAVSGENDW